MEVQGSMVKVVEAKLVWVGWQDDEKAIGVVVGWSEDEVAIGVVVELWDILVAKPAVVSW